MRFLHTSDWHLGMQLRGGLTYREDQEFVINKLCEIAVGEEVDGILLAGDVFDKSISSQEALKMYDQIMTYICGTLQIPVFLIAGNHDGAERLSSCRQLLKNSGLHIAGVLEKEPMKVSLGEVDIYMLPWITTDRVRSVYPDQADEITSMESAYKLVLDKYRESFAPGVKNILISHAFVTGAEPSTSDRSAEVGKATMVSASVFEGFDYVALGHLHGPQQVSENIRYSGTPMAYSFGKEEKQEKSVTIFDTDTMEQKIVPLPQLYRRTTITGTYEELMRADYDRDVVEGYVRLEVTDSYVGLDTISMLREHYPWLIEISGKSLEKEDSVITMTIEELERQDDKPEEIFKRYCEDVLEDTPPEHWLALFSDAVRRSIGEEAEA